MKIYLLLAIALTVTSAGISQTDYCGRFTKIMHSADSLWKITKFQAAFAKLSAAREACPGRAAEVDKKYAEFILDIAGKYKTAEVKTQEAKREAERAKAATATAEAATNLAKNEAARSDSIARVAENLARRAYANDLASKSQLALRDGDRITAFRIAEFAHRFVDSENPGVARALQQALYHNSQPYLPWNFNLEGLAGGINSVAAAPDGQWLASGCEDGSVQLWDVDTGKRAQTFKGHNQAVNSVAFSPDGRFLASGANDNTAKVWDLQTGTCIHTFEEHRDWIRSLAFSPGGKYLATGSDDGSTRMWEMKTGKCTDTLQTGSDGYVMSVSFSQDSMLLATGTNGGMVQIWDLKTGQITDSLFLLAENTNEYLTINCVAFSPHADTLAIGAQDGKIRLWNFNRDSVPTDFDGHTGSILSLAFLPGGQGLITASSDNTAKIWDFSSGKVTHLLQGHAGSVNSLAYCPKNQWLATGASDGAVKVWNLNNTHSGNALFTAGAGIDHYLLTLSPDARRLFSLSRHSDVGDPAMVNIIDIENRQLSRDITANLEYLRHAILSPGLQRILLLTQRDEAVLWNLESGKEELLPPVMTDYSRSQDRFNRLAGAFSNDNRKLAVYANGSVRIWDLESRQCTDTLNLDKTGILERYFDAERLVLVFSPNDQQIALAAPSRTGILLQLWDIKRDTALGSFSGHSNPVSVISFQPDNRHMATGSEDGTVKLWNLSTSKCIQTFTGHTNTIRCLAFSSNGQWLASGSEDNSAKIWDISSGQCLYTIKGHNGSIQSLVFTPDNRQLLTTSGDETVKSWELDAETMIRQGNKNRLAYLTLAQLQAYGLEGLLDQRPENEERLLRSTHTNQLIAFADMYAQLTRNSQVLEQTAPDFARAGRLYQYALEKEQENENVQEKLGTLYLFWSESILAAKRPDTALYYIEQVCRFMPDYCSILLKTWTEKRGAGVDFERCLKFEQGSALLGFGQYFFNLGEWKKAQQLFEKADTRKHEVSTLTQLQIIADSLDIAFDFNRFLKSNDPGGLATYGYFFDERAEYDKARQLFEKAEALEHNTEVLMKLQALLDTLGQNLDFNRFLKSEKAEELIAYGDFFQGCAEYAKARHLFEKAEALKHNPETLMKLQTVSDSLERLFDFQLFLKRENVEELVAYGDFFQQRAEFDKARQLLEKAETRSHDPETLMKLQTVSDSLGRKLDFQLFLKRENVEELVAYGDFFRLRSLHEQAYQLFQKVEILEHSAETLIKLQMISDSLGRLFDFQLFLNTDDPEELEQYIQHFFNNGKWMQARQLCEKQERIGSSPAARIYLYRIAEKMGEKTDFQQFLRSNNPEELEEYARAFTEMAGQYDKYRDGIPDFQKALRIWEQLLTIDSALGRRTHVSYQYFLLAWRQLYIPDVQNAEQSYRRGLQLDPNNKYLPILPPNFLLLNGRLQEAETEFRKWADLPFNQSGMSTYRVAFEFVFKTMEEQDVPGINFDQVRGWLEAGNPGGGR
ncbi:MAG: hypothetical protein IPM81_09285 [Saprospirales bacterium]|nr:hypothetical protein [Saprospirales bacterium]